MSAQRTCIPQAYARGTCSVAGCTKTVNGRGWCSMHYYRWKTFGDPMVQRSRGVAPRPAGERFWTKVDKTGPIAKNRPDLGRCWLWTASLSKRGYGQFRVVRADGTATMAKAHRVAYELVIGPIPDDRPQLDHFACDNPPCVNPFHLTPATPRENVLRSTGPSALHAAQTHCVNGHSLSGSNLYLRPDNGGRQCRACGRDRQLRNRDGRAGLRQVHS